MSLNFPMKKVTQSLLALLLAALPVTGFAAAADVLFSQKNASNTAWANVIVAPTASSALAFNSSKVPISTQALTLLSVTSPAATDLTLAAGGTNQNVVLTPSGTGKLLVGTTVSTALNPATLAVTGNATLDTAAAHVAIFNKNDAVASQFYGLAFTNSNSPEGGVQKPQAYISAISNGGSWSSNWAANLTFATASGGATAAPTEKVRITNGGNVGIGTTSPINPLTVNGIIHSYNGNAGRGELHLSNDVADVTQRLQIRYDTESSITGWKFKAVDAESISFATTNTPRLTIASGGTVSIASSTAGSAGAGALVVTGGLSAGNNGNASFFGGNASISGPAKATFLIDSADAATNGSALAFASSGAYKWIIKGASFTDGSTFTIGTATGVFTSTPVLSLNYSTAAATFAGAVTAAGGTVTVGTTTNGKLNLYESFSSAGAAGIDIQHVTGSAGGTFYAAFEYGTGVLGSITQFSTTGVLYNTASDYRLKDITGPLTNSGTFIDSLKPKTGTWKTDGSKFVGFLAHEFAEVCPSAVTGEKDAVDADGKPIYQAMQASAPEVMANLVAEIQSLRKRLAALEAAK